MSIISDCHLHSHHSGDSKAPMEAIIEAAIAKGLTTICFTEHNDFDYPDSEDEKGSIFLLNTDSYLYELLKLREQYKDKIRILFGLELGLMKSVVKENARLAKSYDFDFIIGSSHLVNGLDPYYPEYFHGKTDIEAYNEYFESIYENIKTFSNYDVYGHLDYVVRYGRDKGKSYSYDNHRDIFDKILISLIENGKGIELNTGSILKGMKEFNPCREVLKRYHSLGGEIITVGSDAHSPENIATAFKDANELLKECGFKYYTIFENRLPEFVKL